MSRITFKGNPVETVGSLPAVGSTAPDFCLTKEDLSDVGLKDFQGKVKILNIFPSLDTGVCAASVKRFNEEIARHPEAVVLNISNDLPFAMKRFCEQYQIGRTVSLSNLRRGNTDFGQVYGVAFKSGPMVGLLSRAVVVVDASNKVVYTEQVPEIAQEPNYAKALEAL